MERLKFVKNKNGWTCFDEDGMCGQGATKQLAEMQYYAYKRIAEADDNMVGGIDICKYNHKL